MNKTNKKSFAARAKDIINRYKRADYDPSEKAELEAALAKLAQEQEAYKQAHGIGEYSPDSIQAQQVQQMQQQSVDGNQIQQFADGGGLYGTIPIENIESDYIEEPYNVEIPQITQSPESVIGQTQGILPSVLAGGVGMLGNIGMALATKPIKYNRSYGASQISLAKERERLARAMNTERNIAMNNLKTSGNRGAYMAGVGAVSSGVGQGIANNISDSYTREAMTNLQQQEKANELNRHVDLMNYQAKLQADQDRKAYIANAINAGIGAGTDINKILGQNAMIESLGSTNYMVSPSTTSAARDLWRGRVIKGKVRPT